MCQNRNPGTYDVRVSTREGVSWKYIGTHVLVGLDRIIRRSISTPLKKGGGRTVRVRCDVISYSMSDSPSFRSAATAGRGDNWTLLTIALPYLVLL